MQCQTLVGPDHTVICGHSLGQHDGDESGMGGPEPCMVCGCQNFTREPADAEHTMCFCGTGKPQATRRHVRGSRGCIHAPVSDTAFSYGDPSLDLPANADRKAAVEGEPSVAEKFQRFKELREERKTVTKWADEAMFTAEPIAADEGPKVYLLWMTPDPLGAIAAASKMYKGEVVRDLSDVTDEERLSFFEEISKTHLKAPFEFVQFHFMIEGVTRGFTHQMVRQRTATYCQESTRFAVKEDMPVGLPPSLAGTTHEAAAEYDRSRLSEAEQMRAVWEDAKGSIQEAYDYLVDKGMPAEDARGLLPTNLLTRLHYRTDLRSLLEHGGNRLCTQAQFEWRLVFTRIVEAIRAAGRPDTAPIQTMHFGNNTPSVSKQRLPIYMASKIADVFRPICYLTGKCEFKANFDRKCSIRGRVEANHERGRAPAEWDEELDLIEDNPIVTGAGPQSVVRNESGAPVFIGAIQPAEWLLNPGAAR